MNYRLIFACGLLIVIDAAVAHAEKVDMSPEELRDTATHVVTGKVSAIYARESKSGDWQVTHYVAELRVAKVEKGAGVGTDQPLYVRYWSRRWIGPGQPPPGTNGHRGIPTTGESARVYLARNAYDGFSFDNKDGGYNVIGANGFEKLK